MPRYYPKRPVKSFQDLTVYQTAASLMVSIIQAITQPKDQVTPTNISIFKKELNLQLTQKLIQATIKLPRLLATTHSQRFPTPDLALKTLDEAMLTCNLIVVHLSEYRDLINPPVIKILSDDRQTNNTTDSLPHTFFEEKIKSYLKLRRKILRLQKAWVRFMPSKSKC